MQALGYIRVSTLEQAQGGVSLEAQEARIRAYCTAAELTLGPIIRDEGVTTDKPLAKRPGGGAVLRVLARREAQHVVVVKLDRLFRNVVEGLTTMQAWDRGEVALHLVDHGGQSINTKSAVGRLFLTMYLGFAEFEKNQISERTIAALRHKKAQHQPYSPTPYGFDREGDMLTPNATEQAVIRRVQRWRAGGRTLKWIATELTRGHVPTKRGGRWYPCTVRALLNNSLHRQEVA
jgi:DNA invertase Pin-like site-specific DNA recombinase